MNHDDERVIRAERGRSISERERLLQGFHNLYEKYHRLPQDPDSRKRKPFDISELMHEQYVTRQQALLWDTLGGDGHPEELEEILRLCVEKVPELNEVKSVVSYGPGSGRNTTLIYHFFNRGNDSKKGKLYLIDLSIEILRNAWDYCERTGIKFGDICRIDPIFFQHLGNIPLITKDDTNYKLHEFLGQTLGNFKDPVEILRRITLNARKGEYLLLGWFDHGPEAYRKEKFQIMNRLLFDELDYLQEAFGNYQVHEKDRWNIMSFMVRDTREEKRGSELLKKKYGDPHVLPPGTEIIVARSRRFEEEEVVKLCEKAGLESVVLNEREEKKECSGYYDYKGIYSSKIDKSVLKEKWMARGDRRYGLFKKVREHDPHRLKRRIFYSLAAAAGIALGGIYFSQDASLHCENSVMHDQDHRISCELEGKPRQFPFESIDDITMIEQSADHIEAMLSVDNAKYRVDIRGKEQVFSFNKSWETKQEIRGMLSERNEASCRGIRWFFEEDRNTSQLFHNVLKYIADCTGSEKALFRTMGLLGYFEGVDLYSIIANLLKDAYETRNGDAVANAASFFSNPRIIRALHTIQATSPVTVLGRDTLDVPLPRWYRSEPQIRKDTRISNEVIDFLHHAQRSPNDGTAEAGIDLVEYYGNNLRQMYSNFPTMWSLQRIGEAVGDQTYSELVRLANDARSLKDHYYLFLFLEDQVRRISEGSNAPTAEERFYADKRSKLIWKSVDGLNSVPEGLLPIVIPPLLEYFPKLDEKTIQSGLNLLYLYSSIFGHECVQENVRRLCLDEGGKLNETNKCSHYFKQIYDSISTIRRDTEVQAEGFPYEFNFCAK